VRSTYSSPTEHRGELLELVGAATGHHETVPDVPILLATASADDVGVDALVAAGIAEVVHGPLVSAELASALARCLTVSEISVSELQP
jgi:CheY-like chemotaxis protein